MEEKKVILAIDDMSMELRTIKVTLDEFFDVRITKSGELALNILETVDVDLILLDIEMPGMSGFDFLDMIRKMPKVKDVPVIFITSHASTELIDHALQAGAKDYVLKPYEKNVLLKKIYMVLSPGNFYFTPEGKRIVLPSKHGTQNNG
jgi:PleD family two-component response regulator